jgi:basic membrane lipoprotein Med (substrate-binding protein (PBP1-ABC) superfamily)
MKNVAKMKAVVNFINIALLLVMACATGERSSTDDTAFNVALLTPGPISDQAWNATAYQGLERIRDSLGASISHIQTKTPAEFEENFRQYGAKGFDLVIGHGFEFQDAARRVGPQFPNTLFATTGGEGAGPNVVALSFAFDEPSYLAGMAAAAMTKTGVLGAIGGTELPPVRLGFEAFLAGARLIRPDITLLTAYIGNWDDASAGKEQALAQLAQKADVIYQNADAAGLGVFQAVRQAKGAWVIGSNADQNGLAPEVTLGSVLIDIPHALLLLARQAEAKAVQGPTIRFATASEVVRWVPNPTAPPLPVAVRARLDSVRAGFAAGSPPMMGPR